MTDTRPAPDLDLARIIRSTFDVLGQRSGTFAVLSLGLVAVPYVISGVISAMPALSPPNVSGLTSALSQLFFTLVAVCLSTLAQGAAILIALGQLNGVPATLADCLRRAARRWLRLIGLALITGLLTGLAALLLLFPAFMVATRWSVSAPILLVEDCAANTAMERSATYTTGARWRIFALGLVYFVAFGVIQAVLSALSAWATPGSGGGPSLDAWLLTPLLQALAVPIGAVGTACLYYELRGDRDSGVHRVAAVFD